VPCIDRRLLGATVFVVGSCLGGCALRLPGMGPAPSPPAPAPLPAPTGPAPAPPAPVVTPAAPTPPAPATAPPAAALPPAGAAGAALSRPRPRPSLGPPAQARNWDEFKQQAARRLMAANPDITYDGPVPEPLLAIPVLEVELNGDGSVRRVSVLRHPRQARDTTQIAIDAVHRAAPYGNMSRLPLPWKWAEVFLFDDQRRFKPRELDK